MSASRNNFFFIWALIALAIVILGFGPTFFLRPLFGTIDRATGSPQLPVHLIVHGIAMTAWFAIFAAQTYLVKSRNISLHRKLGVAGIVTAVLVVISGFVVLIEFIPRGQNVQAITNINVGNTVNFVVFIGMIITGLIYRRTPEIHKRVMLFAAVVNIGPALTTNRMLGESLHILIPDSIPLTMLFKILVVLSLIVFDIRSRSKVHPVSVVGGGILIGSIFLARAIASSSLGTAYYEFLS